VISNVDKTMGVVAVLGVMKGARSDKRFENHWFSNFVILYTDFMMCKTSIFKGAVIPG